MLEFTSEQQYAFDKMMKGENVFLTGEAGTGKSFVINEFIRVSKEKKKNVLVCAPTGIAAINIGGVTIHRSFEASTQPQIDKHIRYVPDTVREADIIIIDEISMCRVDLFDFVTRKIAKAEELCLHRKQLIVVGDFFQLPPVTTSEDLKVLKQVYPHYDKGFAFESENWQDYHFQFIELKQVMRQSENSFITQLNKARIGDVDCIEYFNKYAQKEQIKDGIILTATNKTAEKINNEELNKIKTKARKYKAIISGDVKESDKPTFDVIKLKVGARVIILVNDTEEFMYQNGSLGTVMKMDKDKVVVRLDNLQVVTIIPYEWKIENYRIVNEINEGIEYKKLNKIKVGSFTQMPLKLAYAITIHKSQGQTYDKVNLLPYSFDCGQLYVALSRVRSLEGLCLIQRMRREHLICNSKVREFYGIIDKEKEEKKKDILANFALEVFHMDKKIKKDFPKELQDKMIEVYQELARIGDKSNE